MRQNNLTVWTYSEQLNSLFFFRLKNGQATLPSHYR